MQAAELRVILRDELASIDTRSRETSERLIRMEERFNATAEKLGKAVDRLERVVNNLSQSRSVTCHQ